MSWTSGSGFGPSLGIRLELSGRLRVAATHLYPTAAVSHAYLANAQRVLVSPLRVPVLDVTVFAGTLDAIADVEKFVFVLRFDGLQHGQHTVVQVMGPLREARPILVDERLDLIGRYCDTRIHLFTGPGDAPA